MSSCSRSALTETTRHVVERAAQPAELVAALEAAARREVARRDLLRRLTSRAVRRVSRKWKTSHIASASAVTHPAQYSDCWMTCARASAL